MTTHALKSIILIAAFYVHCIFASEDVHRESLVAMAQHVETTMEHAGVFLQDTLLEQYLDTVLSRIAENDSGSMPVRIRVVKNPGFNAYATANGSIYVFTGLLASIDNEAQIAALLAHELTHITNDHAYRNLLNVKKDARENARIQMGLEIFLGSLANTISNISLRTAVSGYSRDLEREADSLGLIRMVRAGYAPLEFRNLFLKLKKAIEEGGIDQPFFFATHPAVSERIENYYSLMGTDTVGSVNGDIRADAYLSKIRNVLEIDGRVQIASGQLDIAETDFTRLLESDSCNTAALISLGDIARLRSEPQSSSDAYSWYYMARNCDVEGGDASRSLGLYYFKDEQFDSANYYLSKYTAANPASPCINLIENYLKRCAK